MQTSERTRDIRKGEGHTTEGSNSLVMSITLASGMLGAFLFLRTRRRTRLDRESDSSILRGRYALQRHMDVQDFPQICQ